MRIYSNIPLNPQEIKSQGSNVSFSSQGHGITYLRRPHPHRKPGRCWSPDVGDRYSFCVCVPEQEAQERWS